MFNLNSSIFVSLYDTHVVLTVTIGAFVVGLAHLGSLDDPEHCSFVVSTGGKYVGGWVVTFDAAVVDPCVGLLVVKGTLRKIKYLCIT